MRQTRKHLLIPVLLLYLKKQSKNGLHYYWILLEHEKQIPFFHIIIDFSWIESIDFVHYWLQFGSKDVSKVNKYEEKKFIKTPHISFGTVD